MDTKDGYRRMEVVGVDDAGAVYDFLKRNFFPYEPITCRSDPLPQTECPCMKGLDQGYSVKSLDKDGNIIALALNMVMSQLTKTPPNSKKEQLLMDFFEYCEAKSGLDGAEGYLTVQVLCVDAGWRQKGQASSILSRTEELAKEWGFDALECTCTSVFTSMALRRLGWTKTFSQSYESYTDEEGTPIFSPPPPHNDFSHYVRKLT